MEYFRKTKDRLMQSVGLSHAIPEDPELHQAQQRLKSLYTTVQSMHRSMHQYAESMCMVGEAARTLSDDISKFYSKSQPHQQTVGVFIDASLDQESNALLLFKEQFSDDIDHHFDQWLNEIRQKSDQLKSLTHLHVQIQTLRNKIDEGNRNPGQYQSDSGQTGANGIRHDMQTCQVDEKSFHADKITFITVVNNLISTRYERFDVVFMRLMEFQKEFFTDGLEVTEKFAPILDTYRAKNKITGSSTSTATPASPRNPNIPQQQQQPEPVKVQQQQQPQPSAPTKPSPTPAQPQQQQQQPIPQQQPPKPKEQNLFDLDFGASASAPPSRGASATPSPQTSTSQVGGNVFDLFGDHATSTTSTNTTPKPTNAGNHGDVLGDFFAPSSAGKSTSQQQQQQQQPGNKQRTPQPESLEDFFAGSASTQTTPKPKAATANDFGFDFLGGGGSAVRSSNVDDIDDSTDSRPPPTTTSATSNSNIFASKGSSSSPMNFDHFDPLGPSPSSTKASASSSSQPAQQQPQGPQLSEHEEKAQIQNYKQGLELRIEQWRYRHGQERDIQSLLATLQTVLWTGNTWKKVDTTQLLDHGSVKKAFRRALLTVHPDKVSTGTPEMKATADLVFEILNNSFKRYEVQLGMRSA